MSSSERGEPSSRSALPRPAAWKIPLLASTLVAVAWEGIAHQSGSGWVQVLGLVMAGFAAVGMIGPALACRIVSVELQVAPYDAVAGRPWSILLVSTRPARLTPVHPAGPACFAVHTRQSDRYGRAGYASAAAQRPRLYVAELQCGSARRGLIEAFEVDVATASPLGILWWHKRVRLAPASPVHVAPEPAGAGRVPVGGGDQLRDVSPRPARVAMRSAAGETRGVLPFGAGSAPKDVHWPATAHTGSLMVREREVGHAGELVLDVRLADDPDEADEAAAAAAGAIREALRSGRTVTLVTLEKAGRVRAATPSMAVAGRRLARAVPEIGGIR